MAFFDLSTIALRSALPPRPKAYWHKIVANHHLGLYVSSSNGGMWACRIRPENGRYIERRLGRATLFGSKKMNAGCFGYEKALKRAHVFRENYQTMGIYISPFSLHYDGQMTICPIGETITVGHALHHFIEWRRLSASPSTFRSNLSVVNYHLVPRVSQIPLADFNGEHFYKLCKDVLETPPKKGSHSSVGRKRAISELSEEELRKRKKTLNTLISILRTAFTLAWDRGELEGDRPIRCLRQLPTHQAPRPGYLSRRQCERLLGASGKHLRNLIAAALYTGCRVGELTNLKVRDVAEQGFGIYVARSKNNRTRFVFLPNEGMAFFLQLCEEKEPDDLVLTHPKGNHWRRRYVHALKKVKELVDVPKDTTFQTFRHTYASQLVEDGTPLSIVARQLGHSSTNMVDSVYGHLSPSWSEWTIERHFAPLHLDLDISPIVRQKLKNLRDDPTGLARKGTDQRSDGPASKADTMILPEAENSWPRNNLSLFQGPLLEEIVPDRSNAPQRLKIKVQQPIVRRSKFNRH